MYGLVNLSLSDSLFIRGRLFWGDIFLATIYGLYFSHHCILQITFLQKDLWCNRKSGNFLFFILLQTHDQIYLRTLLFLIYLIYDFMNWIKIIILYKYLQTLRILLAIGGSYLDKKDIALFPIFWGKCQFLWQTNFKKSLTWHDIVCKKFWQNQI